jgi:hypothetical protein
MVRNHYYRNFPDFVFEWISSLANCKKISLFSYLSFIVVNLFLKLIRSKILERIGECWKYTTGSTKTMCFNEEILDATDDLCDRKDLDYKLARNRRVHKGKF